MNNSNNKNIHDVILNTINQHQLFKIDKTELILMVSGGADSIALAYIMHDLYKDKSKLAIMHLNHKLRGDSAYEDAQFVKGFCKYLNLKCYLYEKDINKITKNSKSKNIEATAREIRYKLVNNAAKKHADYLGSNINNVVVCTAHNSNDRAESFIMKSIVGCGPKALNGIEYKNNNIARPLLKISHNDLKNYIENVDNPYKDDEGRLWHEDESNQDITKFRAYVRNVIVPEAIKCNKSFIDNISLTMDLINDENKYLDSIENKVIANNIEFKKNHILIKPAFKNLDLVIKRRCVYKVLRYLFPNDARIINKSIESILKACIVNNYTDNIQYNYSVHSNKKGVKIQSMSEYRKSRNRI